MGRADRNDKAELRRRIHASVTGRESELVKMLVDLIEFPTLRLTGAYFREACDYAAEKLTAAGLSATVGRVPSDVTAGYAAPESHYRFLGLEGALADRYYVLARLPSNAPNRKAASVHLNGHICVVEPVPGWTSDPFIAQVDGHRVTGCGAIDMKGGLVMILEAVRAIQEVTDERAGDIYVSVTSDTHFGGNLGAGYVVGEGLGKADYVIIGDTSGPDTILNGYRGQLWVKVDTTGVPTHGSTPCYGRSAVEEMASIIASLRAHRLELEAKRSEYNIVPAESRCPSLSIGTTIKGGVCMNQVAGSCTMTLDRRLIPEESVEEALAGITRAIESAVGNVADAGVSIFPLFSAPATVTEENNELVQALAASVNQIVGTTPKILVHPAFLDLQWFTSGWGIPGVVYGPGKGGAESAFRRKPYREPDESLPIGDLTAATEVLTLTLAELTGARVLS